ncbi:MAG: hypothetical protein HY321_17390 [Armatimonadetes bacterium]|nr:hypothetical protein [Armatimonadota bacterium]
MRAHARRFAWLIALVVALPALRGDDAPPLPPPPAAPPDPPPPAARALLLRCRFREGEERTYHLKLAGKGAAAMAEGGLSLPLTFKMEASIAEKVARVYECGDADVATTMTTEEALLNGTPLSSGVSFPGTVTGPLRVTARVSPSGQVVEAKSAAGVGSPGGVAGPSAALTALGRGLALPERPVKVGESWRAPAPTEAGGEFQATTTLIAIEEAKGRTVARLKHVFAGPVPAQALGSSGAAGGSVTGRQAGDLVLRFDVDAGRILGATGTVDMATGPAAGGAGWDVRLLLEIRLTGEGE